MRLALMFVFGWSNKMLSAVQRNRGQPEWSLQAKAVQFLLAATCVVFSKLTQSIVYFTILPSGFPRLSSTGTLSVLLQDENDNAPQFDQDKYTFQVKENNNPGAIKKGFLLLTPPTRLSAGHPASHGRGCRQ
jgi:hypothetical protein